MDLLCVDVIKDDPTIYQPENCLINDNPIKRLYMAKAHKPNADVYRLLSENVEIKGNLLGNEGDRIHEDEFPMEGNRSLAIVRAMNVEFNIVDNRQWGGGRQTRVSFDFGGNKYDLVVTDPVWKKNLQSFPFGARINEEEAWLSDPNDILITVSLTAPYDNGYCFKLAAGIIILPKEWQQTLS